MPDETDSLKARAATLAKELANERQRYLRNARTDYYTVQVMSFGSTVAGVAATLLGLIPFENVEKWQVGPVAAISTALITASRQLGFQQKANWHYRKVDRLKTLERRLAYELPISPSADNLAAISRAWSAVDTDMSKEWADMQHEATTRPEKDISRRALERNKPPATPPEGSDEFP
jgi:hypothetical protein